MSRRNGTIAAPMAASMIPYIRERYSVDFNAVEQRPPGNIQMPAPQGTGERFDLCLVRIEPQH